MKNEIKYVGTCPACERGIEHGDDTVEQKGIVYHDGCEPSEEPETVVEPVADVVVSQPQSLVVADQKEKKMTKQEKQDLMMEQLLGLVTTLTAKVKELEQRPATVAVASTSVKKSKSEKGAPRADVYYLIKGYATEGRPPQFLKVLRALAQAAPKDGKMTEMEVWKTLMEGDFPSERASKNVGSWNYRQTPFYIFKYYRKDMLAAEYILGPFDVV